VYGIIILIGPVSGSAINPARQVGPVVVESIIGFEKAADRLSQLWVYVLGPIAGGLIGAFLYEFVGRETTATTAAIPQPPTMNHDPDWMT